MNKRSKRAAQPESQDVLHQQLALVKRLVAQARELHDQAQQLAEQAEQAEQAGESAQARRLRRQAQRLDRQIGPLLEQSGREQRELDRLIWTTVLAAGQAGQRPQLKIEQGD
jgi:hypothetical protein